MKKAIHECTECAMVKQIAGKVFAVLTDENGEPMVRNCAFVHKQFFNDNPLRKYAELHTACLKINMKDGNVLTTDDELTPMYDGYVLHYPGAHSRYKGEQPDQRDIPMAEIKNIDAYVDIEELGFVW